MMKEVIANLLDVPFARMFVLAGIVFLMFAVLGKIEGKIDPGNMGRIGAAVLGVILMVLGVAMQYMDVRDSSVRPTQQPDVATQAGFSAPDGSIMAKPIVTASGIVVDKYAIRIVSGTYGQSCNAKPGNATQQLAQSCEGKPECSYAVETVELGNIPANCAKDFVAAWRCGNGSTVYSATLPAAALDKSEKLHLSCAG